MYLRNILSVALVATSAVHALVAPLPILSPRMDQAVSSENPTNLTVFQLPSGNIVTDLASLHPTRSKIPSEVSLTTSSAKRDTSGAAAVLQTLITASYSTAAAVCIVGGLETAGAACVASLVAAGLSTIMSIFYVGWTLYNETPGQPVTALPRFFTEAPAMSVHSSYIPTANCSLKCQLETSTPQQQWINFGNATTSDKLHTVHYYQSDALRGIRLQQYDLSSLSKSKRQTFTVGESDDVVTDWVGAFYWTDDSEAAFDDWNPSAFNGPASTVAGDYFYDNSAEVGCFDLNDDDGTVFQSVWVIDDNDELISLTDDAVNQYLVDCYNIDYYSTKRR